jgi:hypothetical protein
MAYELHYWPIQVRGEFVRLFSDEDTFRRYRQLDG